MKLTIATNLSASAALAAGSVEHGNITVEPTAEQVAALAAEQREALARYVEGGVRYERLAVTSPGWAGVVQGLATAIESERERKAQRAAEVQREIDSYREMLAAPYLYEPGTMPPVEARFDGWSISPNYSRGNEEAEQLWREVSARRRTELLQMIAEADAALSYDVVSGALAEPIAKVLKAASEAAHAHKMDKSEIAPRAQGFWLRIMAEHEAAKAAEREAHAAAIREIVKSHGTPDQIERHEAGVLPAAELKELIIGALFAPLANLSLYDEITEQEVAAECECELDDVRFSTETLESPELSAEEFARLKAVRAAAPKGAAIEIREHVGYERNRTGVDDPEVRRRSIRVSIPFAGTKYHRPYAI